jgi:hypothetical protein
MTKLCVLVTTALLVCLVLGAAPVGAVSGPRYVDQNVARDCAGKVPCYLSIQLAVNAAQAGDTIYVFPGTYEEGVNLSTMGAEGDITLITVDASGNPTPGTVTVDNPGADSEIYTGAMFNGDVTIDGFVLRSFYGAIDVSVGPTAPAPAGEDLGLGRALGWDVEIRNVDASHTGGDGISVRAYGNVTIKDCTTNDNQGNGIGVGLALGDVTITGCTSNDNKAPSTRLGGTPLCWSGGICVVQAGGQVNIENSTANNNDEDGIHVQTLLSGEAGVAPATTADQVVIENCTAIGNERAGFDAQYVQGTLSIQACIAMDNDYGVYLGYMPGAEGALVNGSIICGNECGVYLGEGDSLQGTVVGMNLEGNWWGCAGGPKPEGAGCDPICEPQSDSIAVDFTPWISKISASATVDPVNVGEPTVVSFQFSGNPSPVYLGQGPGDLRGPAPFTVTTDNGKLNGNGATVQEFINAANGTLKVTLVPAREGTATVTVSGPCGVGELEGATAVWG